jgi:hypothetical protein
MELREQPNQGTLARKLGDVSHVSSLLWKLEQVSGCSARTIPDWLLKCAVGRGASHYRRDFDSKLPPDNPAMANEELGVALCLAQHPFDPVLIRAAAQLLSAPDTDPTLLARLAEMERCVPVLLHIADAAGRVASITEPWQTLRATLPRRHRVRLDALPHWSRFVIQTGYTPAGRGDHIEWLTRDE